MPAPGGGQLGLSFDHGRAPSRCPCGTWTARLSSVTPACLRTTCDCGCPGLGSRRGQRDERPCTLTVLRQSASRVPARMVAWVSSICYVPSSGPSMQAWWWLGAACCLVLLSSFFDHDAIPVPSSYSCLLQGGLGEARLLDAALPNSDTRTNDLLHIVGDLFVGHGTHVLLTAPLNLRNHRESLAWPSPCVRSRWSGGWEPSAGFHGVSRPCTRASSDRTEGRMHRKQARVLPCGTKTV